MNKLTEWFDGIDILDEASEAAEEAKKFGLKYKGYGVWLDPNSGKSVAKTVNGKLVWYKGHLPNNFSVNPNTGKMEPSANTTGLKHHADKEDKPWSNASGGFKNQGSYTPKSHTSHATHKIPRASQKDLNYPLIDQIKKKHPPLSTPEEIFGVDSSKLKDWLHNDPNGISVANLEEGGNTLVTLKDGKKYKVFRFAPRQAWRRYLSETLAQEAIPEVKVSKAFKLDTSKSSVYSIRELGDVTPTTDNYLLVDFFLKADTGNTQLFSVGSVFSNNYGEFNAEKLGHYAGVYGEQKLTYDGYGKQLRRIVEIMRGIGSFYHYANSILPDSHTEEEGQGYASSDSRYKIVENFGNADVRWRYAKQTYRIMINNHKQTKEAIFKDLFMAKFAAQLQTEMKKHEINLTPKALYEFQAAMRDVVNYNDWTQFYYTLNEFMNSYGRKELFSYFFNAAADIKKRRTEKIAAEGKLVPRDITMTEAAAGGTTYFLRHDPLPVSETFTHHELMDDIAYSRALTEFRGIESKTKLRARWHSVQELANKETNRVSEEWRFGVAPQDQFEINDIQQHWQSDGIWNMSTEYRTKAFRAINRVIGGQFNNKPAVIEFPDRIERGIRLESFHVMSFFKDLKKGKFTLQPGGFSFKPNQARRYGDAQDWADGSFANNRMGIVLRIAPKDGKLIGMPLNGVHKLINKYTKIRKDIDNEVYYNKEASNIDDFKPWKSPGAAEKKKTKSAAELRNDLSMARAGVTYEELGKLMTPKCGETSANYTNEYEIIRPGNALVSLEKLIKHVFINRKGDASIVYEVLLQDEGITQEKELISEDIKPTSPSKKTITWKIKTGGPQWEEQSDVEREIVRPKPDPLKKTSESLLAYDKVFAESIPSVEPIVVPSVITELNDPQLVAEYILQEATKRKWIYKGEGVFELPDGTEISF